MVPIIKKRFSITLFVLIIIVFLLTFAQFFGIGLTTYDDMINHIAAVSNQNIFKYALSMAISQGRFFFMYSEVIYRLPYLIDEQWFTKTISISSIIFNILLFGSVLGKFTKIKYLNLLVIVLFAAFLQNSFEHNLVNSYHLVFTLSMSFLLISLLLFSKFINTDRKIFLVFSVIFFFLALLGYETFLVYILVYVLFFLIYRREKNSYTMKDFMKYLAPYLGAIILYIVLYAIFRYIYPSRYEGNQIRSFSPLMYVATILQFSTNAFPLSIFFSDSYNYVIHNYSYTTQGDNTNLWFILSNLQLTWVVRSLAVSAIVYSILHRRETINNFKNNFKKYSFLIKLSIILIFIPSTIISLVEKYQAWVYRGVIGFIVTYFSYFGVVLLIAVILLTINSILNNNPRLKLIFVLFTVVGIALISIMTDYMNYHIYWYQNISFMRLEAMKHITTIDDIRKLKNNSIILAPTIFDNNTYVKYWESYFKSKIGKELIIVKDDALLTTVLHDNPKSDLYYLRFSKLRMGTSYMMTFSHIDKRQYISNHALIGDKITLLIYSNYKQHILTLSQQHDGVSSNIFIDNSEYITDNGLLSVLINKQSSDSVLTKKTIRGKYLDSSSLSISDYVEGFIEKEITTSWQHGCSFSPFNRFPNSISCASKGEMLVNNPFQQPVEAILSMNIATDYPHYSYVNFVSSLITDTIEVNNSVSAYKRKVIFPSGTSTIKLSTSAPVSRISGPKDIRIIISNYRLLNFHIKKL